MNILDDTKIQRLITRRELSKSRIKTFRAVFKEIYKITGLTLSELIKNAKKEQELFIKDGKIVFESVEDREIATYFYQYYNHLKTLGRSKKTIKDYLGTLRTFYSEYDIELPKPIKIEIEKK